MPCYNCSCEFGLLKKEVGCEICGFSFCGKCCSKKAIPLQSTDEKKKPICNQCFEKMASSKMSNTGNISPPLAHKKRMTALKKQSISMDAGYDYHWGNEKDKEISERLQRLKKDRQKDLLPSELEIEERLAKLKGIDPAKYKAPPIMVYRPAEKRTSIEQATDLMKQLKEEAELESKLIKPEDEIEIRLARLKDQVPKKNYEGENIAPAMSHLVADSSKSEEMDIEAEHATFQKECMSAKDIASQAIQNLNKNEEIQKLLASFQHEKDLKTDDKKKEEEDKEDEEEANKLIEKLMASNMDDDEMSGLDSLNHTQSQESLQKGGSVEDDEEFPWCVICTEDAKMRCFGCDGDLYCMNCFKECHDSLDVRNHKTCPYFPPKDPLA